ncbi:transposase family protein [Streptomyces sp. NPDC002159]
MCRQSATVCLTKSPPAAQRAAHGIAERLGVLRDPRDRRGRRHALVAVLLTACCAVLAGACSYLAIGQWAAMRRRTPWPASAYVPQARWACAAHHPAPRSAAS